VGKTVSIELVISRVCDDQGVDPARAGEREHKSYAPGVGLVYIEQLKGKTVKVEVGGDSLKTAQPPAAARDCSAKDRKLSRLRVEGHSCPVPRTDDWRVAGLARCVLWGGSGDTHGARGWRARSAGAAGERLKAENVEVGVAGPRTTDYGPQDAKRSNGRNGDVRELEADLVQRWESVKVTKLPVLFQLRTNAVPGAV